MTLHPIMFLPSAVTTAIVAAARERHEQERRERPDHQEYGADDARSQSHFKTVAQRSFASRSR